jgi:multicomponent Na+:H+ antiporter subunit D
VTAGAAQLPALQVIVPLLTAPLVLMLLPRGLPWLTATAASLLTFAIACQLTLDITTSGPLAYELGGWPAPYGIELTVDGFSALLLLIVSGASSVTLLATRRSVALQIETARQPLFYAAWLLCLSGLVGIVVAGDAFNIFVFMEISSLASYVLIAGGPDRCALPAVLKYLIMGTIGATFYLIGVGLIYMLTGTLNLADMAERIAAVSDQRPILVAAGFITLGLALKAAVFPLHVWMPNAYTYAPHAVTAFIAACSTKVAVYVLLRFDFIVLQPNLAGHELQFTWFLAPLALLGILAGSAVALFEGHLKRLLAFSSLAQIGYILLGASLVSVAGLTAALLHMFNHALAKGGLFLAVACLAASGRGLRLTELRGAGRCMPWTLGAFVVAGLSLIGVPGTAGFVSKWYLLQALLAAGALGWVALVCVLVSSVMSVAYLWRVVEPACYAPVAAAAAGSREAPSVLLLATWLVALANIYFGLHPDLPLALAGEGAAVLLGVAP